MKKIIFRSKDRVTITSDGKSDHKLITDFLNDKKFEVDFSSHKLYKSVPGIPGMRKAMTYRGVLLWDLAEEELHFIDYFFPTLKEIVRTIEIAGHIIKKEKPDIVIAESAEPETESIARQAAEEKGIEFRSRGRLLAWARELKNAFVRRSAEAYISLMRRARHLRADKKTDKNKALFVPYYANHVDVLNPVIGEMKRRRLDHGVVLLDNLFNVAKKAARKHGLEDYEVFEKFMGPDVWKKGRAAGKEFSERFRKIRERDIKLEYKGIDIWPFYRKRMEHFFRVRMPETVRLYEASLQMLDRKKPSVIVLANSTSLNGKVLARSAKERKIKSVVLQHGSVQRIPRYTSLEPDVMAVEGKHVKSFLADLGMPEKKLVVTGQPRYDKLFKGYVRLSKKQVHDTAGIPEGRDYAVLTTQRPVISKPMIRPFLKAVKRIRKKKNLFLVIKLHPGEYQSDFYKRAVAEEGIDDVSIVKDIELYSLLKYSRLMYTVSSTTTLEALLLGVPVIMLNFTGMKNPLVYAEKGRIPEAHSQKDIEKLTEKLLFDKRAGKKAQDNRKRIIREFCCSDDGRSSQRVADLIIKIAGK